MLILKKSFPRKRFWDGEFLNPKTKLGGKTGLGGYVFLKDICEQKSLVKNEINHLLSLIYHLDKLGYQSSYKAAILICELVDHWIQGEKSQLVC